MTQQRYIDYEEDFLEAMATRFGFSGKTRFVFVTRLREQYAELKDSSFAGEWGDVLLEDIKDSHSSDPAIILRDRLKVICDRIESAGCDFNGTQRGKWKVAKCWLREEIFPQWWQENTSGKSAGFLPLRPLRTGQAILTASGSTSSCKNSMFLLLLSYPCVFEPSGLCPAF